MKAILIIVFFNMPVLLLAQTISEFDLIGTWKVEDVIKENNSFKDDDQHQFEEILEGLQESSFTLESNQSCTVNINYLNFSETRIGKWTFDPRQNLLVLDEPGGSMQFIFRIKQKGNRYLFYPSHIPFVLEMVKE